MLLTPYPRGGCTLCVGGQTAACTSAQAEAVAETRAVAAAAAERRVGAEKKAEKLMNS